MRKGQAPLLTHAIMVGFSIFLAYAVVTTLASIKSDYQEVVGGNEIMELCFTMKSAIDKIYLPSEYVSEGRMGSIDVKLPERMADIKYTASFFNRSLVIKSSAAFNYTCKIGYAVSYDGTTSGGLTRFSYTRYSNGTQVIAMAKI